MGLSEETLSALQRCVDLIADAIVKKTSPIEDEISERQANAKYGKGWMRFHKKRKNINYYRKGRTRVYSIHELDCLVAAEWDNFDAVMETIGKAGQEINPLKKG